MIKTTLGAVAALRQRLVALHPYDVPEVLVLPTDGGHLAHHGIRTIGFAPGEERFAHTVEDQINLSKMQEALVGNVGLALTLPAIPKGAA